VKDKPKKEKHSFRKSKNPFVSAVLCFPLGLYLSHWYELNGTHWTVVLVLTAVMVLQLVSIGLQPSSKTPAAFKVT